MNKKILAMSLLATVGVAAFGLTSTVFAAEKVDTITTRLGTTKDVVKLSATVLSVEDKTLPERTNPRNGRTMPSITVKQYTIKDNADGKEYKVSFGPQLDSTFKVGDILSIEKAIVVDPTDNPKMNILGNTMKVLSVNGTELKGPGMRGEGRGNGQGKGSCGVAVESTSTGSI